MSGHSTSNQKKYKMTRFSPKNVNYASLVVIFLLSHFGTGALQVPPAWQIISFAPIKKLLSLQENTTRVPSIVESVEYSKSGFSGSGGQSTSVYII